MAQIVLGLGTSHSPHVSTAPEQWYLHADRDRRNPNLNFAALVAAAPAGIEAELNEIVFREKAERCNRNIDALSAALAAAAVDAVVVIGDDQRELFLDEFNPAFAIYTGPVLTDFPPDMERADPSHVVAMWARHSAVHETYPASSDLANHLVGAMCAADFDVATAQRQFDDRSLGHAFTFVRLRLMRERIVPMVPIFINCYFPPNQPSPARCFAFGQALRGAIETAPGNGRVAVVASGGLTHFVIDEQLDRQVLRGITEKKSELLCSIDPARLNSGSSEIRNWIAAAGALDHLRVAETDYTPAYRTEAGTGCGMAFVRWEM
jgi:3-O-methylgallate 3,4-dioxygenase